MKQDEEDFEGMVDEEREGEEDKGEGRGVGQVHRDQCMGGAGERWWIVYEREDGSV